MKKERKSMIEILDESGWAFFQTGRVKINGHKHLAYAIETYPQNIEGMKPAKYEELVAAIKRNFKNVWEGKTYCEYAPEIKKNLVAAWR